HVIETTLFIAAYYFVDNCGIDQRAVRGDAYDDLSTAGSRRLVEAIKYVLLASTKTGHARLYAEFCNSVIPRILRRGHDHTLHQVRFPHAVDHVPQHRLARDLRQRFARKPR